MIFQIVIMKRWTLDASACNILYCKPGGHRNPKQFRIELMEKIISGNHRDEFFATLGRPRISPSPLRLTSGLFPDVITATEKQNPIQRDSVLCAPVKEIPEIS
ncbi:piggyBac transposable element-derived protein 4 [Trichonephila clavipes]|nr:piggyBac transposable element-derived protein 4 [Trichonephila clavipes]